MNKKTWVIAFVFALPWTALMMIFNLIMNGKLNITAVVSTLLGGLIAGVLFALAMHNMAKNLLEKVIITNDEDEITNKEGGANHIKGAEGVGGKLALTNKRLIFKSHNFNIQNHQESFTLDQIEHLQIKKTFGFLENGLEIQLSDCKTHKFIVDNPRQWVDAIMKSKNM